MAEEIRMTAPVPAVDVVAIRARAEAAVSGPWRALGTGVRNGDHWYVVADGEAILSIASNDGSNEDERQPLAEFIAHAREDVPVLLAALESVTVDRDEARAALARVEALRDEWVNARDAWQDVDVAVRGFGHDLDAALRGDAS